MAASIQPCALLLLVGPDWRIEAISANAAMVSGQRPTDVVGQPLADFIGSKAIHALRNRMSWLSKDESEVHDFGVQWGEVTLDVRAARDGSRHLIEAELSVEPRLADGIGMVRSMSDRLRGDDPLKLADQAMRQLCALTGFDRLALCDIKGQVIVSAGRTMMESYEGKSRVPKEPRMVADRDCDPVPLIGEFAPEILDRANFRAPDGDELEGMANAGIVASMALPLMIDGEPVALLHAHHPAPRRCSAERRSVAHLFAERLVARMARRAWTP